MKTELLNIDKIFLNVGRHNGRRHFRKYTGRKLKTSISRKLYKFKKTV